MSDLMDLLPEYYRDSAEVVELQGAFGHWSDALDAAREPECGFADNARTLGLAFAISRAAGHPPDGNAP